MQGQVDQDWQDQDRLQQGMQQQDRSGHDLQQQGRPRQDSVEQNLPFQGQVHHDVSRQDLHHHQHQHWLDFSKKAVVSFGVLTTAALAVLSGCGQPKAVPLQDEFAGDSGQTLESQQSQSSSDDDAASHAESGSSSASGDGSDTNGGVSGQDSGDTDSAAMYADGTYSVQSQYGPISEDSIDVSITLVDGAITSVGIVEHAFTAISKKHQDAFSAAISGEVVGKDIDGLSVGVVAGASWTSQAFNMALDAIREQAQTQAQ